MLISRCEHNSIFYVKIRFKAGKLIIIFMLFYISENYTSLWSYNHTFTSSSNQNYTFSFTRRKRNQDLENTLFPYSVFPKNPFLNGEFLRFSLKSTTSSTTTSSTTSTTTSTTTKPIISSNRMGTGAAAKPDDGNWIFKYKYFDRCGRPAAGQVIHTIIGGQEAMEGQFPWMVAIYQLNSQKTWDYSCGGSLISDRHVLTGKFSVFQIKVNK